MFPQTIVILTVMGMIGLMFVLLKVFSRVWLWLLLLGPSWGGVLYDAVSSLTKGEPLNFADLFFFLYPIDQYLVNSELCIVGLVFLGMWLYVLLVNCARLMHGWGLPLAPLLWWMLGKGLPNTMGLLNPFLPAWLLVLNGFPLVLAVSAAFSLLLILRKRRQVR